MPPRFLPALRTASSPAARRIETSTALNPVNAESKIVLYDYYQALINAGVKVGGDKRKPWDVDRAIAEGYERVVWVYKAVEAIAGNSSRLPFRLRQGEEVVDDHPLYRVLNHGKANPLETGRQFRKRLSAQALLSRPGAFVEVTRDRVGDVTRVDLLPPGRTKIVPGSGADLISHYVLMDPDGRVNRRIEPERVRWIREPHPTDPYSGITPLEAIGYSVELDHFARYYNLRFMSNDGRPGGVIAIDKDREMDERDMNRIEARFGKGPHEAGKISVIEGSLSYVDLAAKPRDMAYGEASRNSKIEILVGFGVPESQLGNAADRTFSNADEEAEAFWTITMVNHNDLIVSAFDEDSDDGLTGFLDTSTVEALQRAEVAKREESRKEFEAGLISIDEYRERAGHQPIDLPHTRALYIASGKTPIPTREEDAEALGLAAPEAEEEETPQDPSAGGDTTQEDDDDGGTGNGGGGVTPPAPTTGGTGGQRLFIEPVEQARALAATGTTGAPAGPLRLVGGTTVKALPAAGVRLVKAAPPDV